MADTISEREKKAKDYDFEVRQFPLGDVKEETIGKEKDIPPGYIIVGIRFRSKNLIKNRNLSKMFKN